jgi:hypothetical protein
VQDPASLLSRSKRCGYTRQPRTPTSPYTYAIHQRPILLGTSTILFLLLLLGFLNGTSSAATTVFLRLTYFSILLVCGSLLHLVDRIALVRHNSCQKATLHLSSRTVGSEIFKAYSGGCPVCFQRILASGLYVPFFHVSLLLVLVCVSSMELFSDNSTTFPAYYHQGMLLPISMLMCCRHEQTCIHIDYVERKTLHTEGPTTPDLCITKKRKIKIEICRSILRSTNKPNHINRRNG